MEVLSFVSERSIDRPPSLRQEAAKRPVKRGKKTAKYLIFLFRVPLNVSSIDDVGVVSNAITLYDDQGNAVASIPADGCEAFLAPDGAPENGYTRVQSL